MDSTMRFTNRSSDFFEKPTNTRTILETSTESRSRNTKEMEKSVAAAGGKLEFRERPHLCIFTVDSQAA